MRVLMCDDYTSCICAQRQHGISAGMRGVRGVRGV